MKFLTDLFQQLFPSLEADEEELVINFVDDAAYTFEFKIVVVGSENVGKKMFLNHYLTGETAFAENQLSAFQTKRAEAYGERLELDIRNNINTPYNKVPHGFYLNTTIAIILFDTTRMYSLEDSKLWCDSITKYCPHATRMLVGCKADFATRVVFDKGYQVACEKKCLYMELNATNLPQVQNVFIHACSDVLDRISNKEIDPSCYRVGTIPYKRTGTRAKLGKMLSTGLILIDVYFVFRE